MAEIGKKPTAIRIHSAIYSEVEKGQFIKLDGVSEEINGTYKVLDSHKEPSGGVSILGRKIEKPADKKPGRTEGLSEEDIERGVYRDGNVVRYPGGGCCDYYTYVKSRAYWAAVDQQAEIDMKILNGEGGDG